MRNWLIIPVIVSIVIASCGKLNPPKKDQMPKGHPPTNGMKPHGEATIGQPKVIAGVIAETMSGGEYTYVRLKTETGDVWAAGPVTAVTVGDSAEVSGDMPMVDFKSEALKRSFEVIFFSPAITKPGQLAAMASPHGMAGMQGMGGSPHGSTMSKIQLEKPDFTGINKPQGGMTVAQAYADRKKLAGKKIKVCGRVVKVNLGILGKNWVHIQDGTGKEGSNDLTITTTTAPAVKDKVIAEGVLVIDKDFGAGYKYEVIVEDGVVSVEK